MLGVAIGLGLNAKYAMIYLPLCYAIYAAVSPKARATLKHPGTWVALAVALLLIAPNLIWNAQHQFATFEHTRENANWNGRFPNILGLLAFLGTQIAIAGPVPFAAFMLAAIGRAPGMQGAVDGDRQRFLLAMSLPVFLLIAAQALISKANGNWAATGFPAAAVLAAAAMLMLALAARHDLHAGPFGRPAVRHLLCRLVRRHRHVRADRPRARQDGRLGRFRRQGARRSPTTNDLKTVVFISRGLTASMIYELRDSGLDIRAYVANPERARRPFRDDAAVDARPTMARCCWSLPAMNRCRLPSLPAPGWSSSSRPRSSSPATPAGRPLPTASTDRVHIGVAETPHKSTGLYARSLAQQVSDCRRPGVH